MYVLCICVLQKDIGSIYPFKEVLKSFPPIGSDPCVYSVITQRTTRSSGYWTDILISIKCPEGTNETEYIMSLAARANEIQHRAWKLQYYNTLPFIEK